MDSTTNHKQGNQRVVRHAEYYIHGGDIIFLVENILFRVHRYFFTRESAYFRNKLPHPPPPGEITKGTTDNHPLLLEDALHVDFERFLWVFYNPKYSLYDATVEEWTSILKLAHQWDFVGVKSLAIRELEQIKIHPLQKISIYHSYGIDRCLLQAAYTAFAIRDEPITIEEGQELGLETVVQLARARELVRAPATGGKSIKDARSPVNIAGAELDDLIRGVFRLPPPDRDPNCQVLQQKPTGQGTTTGGRAEHQSGTQQNGTSSSDSKTVQGRDRGHLTPATLRTKQLT
ncbi:hypothetical protein DFH94DRAFT_319337 [Russula ochroleuca]|uniref:BTB domain-containing protein n=1 Tax=Russula ochroleuca TaxID=152965 RepID=A0A9P5TBE6_9AGAM|nr:hypothetical protein DFH94DRAFT_319337 [Russula ochroleuca]